MSTIYTTKQGDVVDYVCAKYYGGTSGGQVEAVLVANPGLADYGPELPSGVKITLPVVSAVPQQITQIFG
jgi:phage tail protein X